MITADSKGLIALQTFVRQVNEKHQEGETFSYDKHIKGTPITADDVRGMLDSGVLTRDNTGLGGRNYRYQWNAKTLDIDLIKKIQAARREYVRKRKEAERQNKPFSANSMNQNKNKTTRLDTSEDSLKMVKQLKKEMELFWEQKKPFPLYAYCEENFGWSPYYISGLNKVGVATKHADPNSRRSLWEWTGDQTPTLTTLENIKKGIRELTKKQNKKTRSKKPQNTQVPEISQKQEVATEVTENKPEPSPIEAVDVPTKPKIPITVDVTTEGDKKIVNIKIQI